jgi:predicted SAM-dependent methyltransferase
VGCGKNIFQGWINTDINPRSDLIIFLQKKLPFKNNYLEKIYLEHVLEHVPYRTAVFFLKEAYRTLQHGSIIRIAMPDRTIGKDLTG